MWIGFIVISIVGTLLHFLYEISGHNKVALLFAAVNESTWEHIKIALTPTFLWGLLDGFKYGTSPNYFIAKSASLLVIYFYVTIFCSQYVFNYIVNMEAFGFAYQYVSVIILFMVFGTYMVGTLEPVHNFLFKDPISNKYGKEGHTEE